MLCLLWIALSCVDPPYADSGGGQDSGSSGGAGGDGGAAVDPVECPLPALSVAQEWVDAELVDPADVDGDLGTGGPGLALGDLDGDGWLDLVMAVPVAPSILFLNDGSGQLARQEVVLPAANGAALSDVDQDGDLDLWLGRGLDFDDVLMRNGGDGLSWTEEALPGPRGESFTASFADLDGDGDDDAFVGRFLSYFDVSDLDAPVFETTDNQLLINEGGSFVDASDRLPADSLADPTFQAQVLDADGDGDLDLYASNDFGMFLQPNRLLLNDGDARFTEAVDCACDLEVFGMGAAIGDTDLDGDDDLYLTNLGGPVFLEADGDGRFVDATLARGAAIPYAEGALASWGSALVDLDLDGYLDLPVIFGAVLLAGGDLEAYSGSLGESWTNPDEQPDHLLLNQQDGSFVDVSADVGFADPSVGRDVVVGDLDRDGIPDLVTGGIPFLRVWRTGGGCGPGVTVQGLPVGAEVTVSAAGRTTTQRFHPSTTLSTSAPEVVMGLGEADRADQVRVSFRGQTLLDEADVARGSVLAVPR